MITDLRVHLADPGVHVGVIPAFTFDRSWCSPWAATRSIEHHDQRNQRPVEPKDSTVHGITQPLGAGRDGVEHRLKITWRTRYDLQARRAFSSVNATRRLSTLS